MSPVDERRERGVRRVIPATGSCLTRCVLSGGDDLEVSGLELAVDVLPAWQIEPAPSPGGPGHQQHLLAAEVRQVDRAALAIRDGDVGRHPRRKE